jgi:hypothetical protein
LEALVITIRGRLGLKWRSRGACVNVARSL